MTKGSKFQNIKTKKIVVVTFYSAPGDEPNSYGPKGRVWFKSWRNEKPFGATHAATVDEFNERYVAA